MKSHSYVPTTNTRELAQKINRSGVATLHSEEIAHVEQNLSLIAGACDRERAVELFAHFGRTLPKGFICEPVAGEMDAYIERLKKKTDERKRL